MLVDDNPDDNFYHERVIKKNDPTNIVIAKQTGMDALEYLRARSDTKHTLHPDLILLDINMPGMNGWEFLDEYNKLDKQFKSQAVVVMLTNSVNPDDMAKAELHNEVCEFKTKPLTNEMLNDIRNKYFTNSKETEGIQ